MTIQQVVLQPQVPTFIELFEIDFSTINNGQIPELVGTVFRITPMSDSRVDGAVTMVKFKNQNYTPFPVRFSGMSQSSEGAPARPQIHISNVDKTIGRFLFSYNDIIGATVTYIRTFDIYLGSNLDGISLPPLKYYVSKKLAHDKRAITLELRDYRDKERMQMPRNQMLKSEYPGLGINKSAD
jgi:lambda family phage minor tail protein L